MSQIPAHLDFSKEERQMHTIHDQATEWLGMPESLSEILLHIFLRLRASTTGNGASSD